MIYQKNTSLIIVFLLMALFFHANWTVFAQSSNLILEWEQHWETYGIGGTCNFGTHNFFVGDVDSDDTMELITGGYQYTGNFNFREAVAPFYIWNWNGTNFNLETSHKWPGTIRSIYAGDIDRDGSTEIITATLYSLRIWNWNGEVLSSKASYEGISANSIFIKDLDEDGFSEIIAVGSSYNGTSSIPQIQLLKWDENNARLRLCASIDKRANSVYACDLDNDDVIEIVTGGYENEVENSTGQICIWHWNDDELSLEDHIEWCMIEDGYGVDIGGNPMGNTKVSNLKVGDIDEDGTPEIITGGFTYDGEKVKAQLRIWNWNDQTLTLEESYEWASDDITEVKAVALSDVDGDGQIDVVTSGFIGVYGGFGDQDTPPEQAQLRVWSWNEEILTLKENEDWDVGDGVTAWNVATGDIDKDGTVEIITVGCMYEAELCDPDLRIWSISKAFEPPPFGIFAILVVIAILSIVAILFLKKR